MTKPKTIPTTSALRSALTNLDPAKAAAVAALASGATHAEAADAAGVKRETVTRWLGSHAGFRSALATMRYADADEQATRVGRIRGKALAAIEAALDAADADPSLALAVIRALPSIDCPGQPPDAEAVLADDIARVRPTIPPPPPLRDANGRVDTLTPMLEQLNGNYAGETPMERTERLSLERLAAASGIEVDS